MDEIKISAKEYLKEQGIELNATSLICFIDGYMRQPDLCLLMESYAKHILEQQQPKND
jgi:hypothetical protein